MAKITGKYEVLYIIDPAQGEEGIAALVEKFKAMVEAEGTVSNVALNFSTSAAMPSSPTAGSMM